MGYEKGAMAFTGTRVVSHARALAVVPGLASMGGGPSRCQDSYFGLLERC